MATFFCLVLTMLFIPVLSGSDLERVEIEVDGTVQEYSMSQLPPPDSPLVKMEKEEMHGSLDMESFVKDLSNVGSFVRIAYNGIGAAGPEFQALQNEVQRLGFDISKLCDKSAITVAMFKTTIRSILYELKAAYEFLIDNHEKLALVTFTRFSNLAEKMATAAEKLEKEFEAQGEVVNDVLDKAKMAGANQAIKITEVKAEQEKHEADLELQQKFAKEHEELELKFRDERLQAERQQDNAMNSKTGFLNRITNAICSSFGLGNLFDDGSEAALKVSRYRQRTIEKLENEKEQRKLKQEAYKAMAQLAHDIKMAEKNENLAVIAVDALQKASWSLKQLVFILRKAAIFWNNLKTHCKSIAEEKIETLLNGIDEEDRKKYWSSMPFKRKMYMYMSKWVALQSICTVHLEQIKVTQKELHAYMREDPTYEESKQNLKELVENFEEDLKSAQDRISQQNFEDTKKIQSLKNEVKDEL